MAVLLYVQQTTITTIPLPCQIANGDLDGDLYFVCWNEVVLNHLRAVRTGGIPTPPPLLSNNPPSQSSMSSGALIHNENWFRDGQMRMSDAQLSNISDLISKLYGLWKKKDDCPRENDRMKIQDRPSTTCSRSPISDFVYFGRAYKDSLDLVKHGGKVYLPSHLWKPIPESLHSFLSANPL